MAQRNRLLAWQWSLYAENHVNRSNLVIHVLTVPLFQAGTVALGASPLVGWWLAPLGLVAMVLAVALQGRGHGREAVPPVPFSGPLDVVRRLFAEQWITFPRFVLSGGLARAWRATGLVAAQRRRPARPATNP